MSTSIDDILEVAKLPQQTIRLCLRGDLVADHQALEAELKAMGDFTQSHLGEADPRTPVAQQIKAVEQAMRDAETSFTFKALGRRKYRELLVANAGDPGQKFNPETFPRALIAACAVDPVMTPTDVDRLFDVLNEGAVEALFMAAYTINEGLTRVPFSATASDVTKRLATSS